MKKFLLSSIFLFSLAYGVIACTEGLPTDNWEEPVVPADPAVTTLERHPLAERPYTQTDSVMVRR